MFVSKHDRRGQWVAVVGTIMATPVIAALCLWYLLVATGHSIETIVTFATEAVGAASVYIGTPITSLGVLYIMLVWHRARKMRRWEPNCGRGHEPHSTSTRRQSLVSSTLSSAMRWAFAAVGAWLILMGLLGKL